MKTQLLDFAEGRINADWAGQGDITMKKQRDGILLESGNSTGMLLTTLPASFQPEIGIIRAASPVPTKFYFAWVMMNMEGQDTMTMPFGLATGESEEKVFSLRGKREWGIGEKKIGIILPPRSTILLMNIELQQPNIVDTVTEVIRSFWVLDEARPYSINFVWGPLIGMNSAERSQLYDLMPPPYYSGTFAIYVIVAGIIILLLAARSMRKTSRRSLFIRCGVVMFVAWLFLDMRMGVEFLSWVSHDHTTYISQSEERVFRDRERFYDFAEFAKPYVQNRTSYVFFAERPWPYLGNMRYLTYPSIPGIDYEKDDTWVIYQRADMGVNEEGRLTVDGTPVTPAGTILGRFDASSFVFRLAP